MQICGSLKLLMALLGPSWPILGPIWPPNDPQNCPQSGPTMVQKLVQKMTPKKVKFKPILGPKMDREMDHLGERRQQSQEAGAILKALVSKMGPRWLKTSPNSPRQSLGSLLGPSEAVLEGFGTPNALKNIWSFKVFAVVRFRHFGALDNPLGPILAPLGPIWSRNGFQNTSSDCSKSSQDGPSWRSPGRVPGSRCYLKSSCFQDGPKMPQDVPEQSKIASWEPSWAFRAVLEGLGSPKPLKNKWFFKVFAVVRLRYFGALDGALGPILAPLGPIWSQNGSQNGSPDGSKSSQDGPSWRSPGSPRKPEPS